MVCYFQEGEGDCDADEHCLGSLECGKDNCVGTNFDSTDDCCFDPNPTTTSTSTTTTTTTTTTTAPMTTTKPYFQPDCKALKDAEELLRNTRIAFGCDVGNPDISLDTCSQISCLEDVLKKTSACTRGSEQMDCTSLENVSKSIEALYERHCLEVASFTNPLASEAGNLSSQEVVFNPCVLKVPCHQQLPSQLPQMRQQLKVTVM